MRLIISSGIEIHAFWSRALCFYPHCQQPRQGHHVMCTSMEIASLISKMSRAQFTTVCPAGTESLKAIQPERDYSGTRCPQSLLYWEPTVS